MQVEESQIISLLKEIHLFHGMDDARLHQVAHHFTPVPFKPDQVIIAENVQGEAFFIIFDGEVIVSRKVNDVETQLDILVTGDFFGEESLLRNQLTNATVTAARDVTLLQANRQHFHELTQEFPEIKTDLDRIIRSRQFIRTHHFDWLNDDEVVYQVSRKHVAYLVLVLLGPSLVFLLGAALFLFLISGGSISTTEIWLSVFAGLIMSAGLLWGLWSWIDWGNDYYIVTNQRTVWIEQIIFLYESRMEAPLSMIQAVNVRTDLLGRLLGYGDITVNTYTGRLILRIVEDPYQLAALIQEHWRRAQINFQREQKDETVRSVNRILGREVSSPAPVRKVIPVPAKGDDFQELSFISTYFGNIFNLRYEDGNTITYRKHWLILIRKTWKPFLAFLLVFFSMLACTTAGWYEGIDVVSLEVMLAIGVLIIIFVLFPWWLYNYADWRNDIYQLTDKNIFDIERKPLGTEVRKSGSLDRILSLEHERPGFVGYLFNVGNVIINFGDAKFDFIGVYEPARVQQDIFNRMHQMRLQQQIAEATRERDRVLSILTIYHNTVHGAQDENTSG